MDKLKVKLDNMEMTNGDTILKPALSSTKSIDEGFESDPDRELSNTETETNHLPSASVVVQSQTFDVLQRTDRDGVQHTQITRRPLHAEFPGHKPFESGTILSTSDNQRRNKELDKNRCIYTNPKVSIPRAGGAGVGASSVVNQRNLTTPSNGALQSTQLSSHLSPNHLQYNNHVNNPMIIDQHNQRHRLAGKLAKSTELMLRSGNIGREHLNFSNTMNDNLSQVALINGKLICVNMPVTQIIPAASIPSASASSLANASHNLHIHNSKRHFSNTTANSTATCNQATKINNNHHQKYISNGRNSNNQTGANDANSIAQQVNNAIIQNANSSIHTFYPAEGNISLIKSQYGLKYKSSHGIQEQPVPMSLWSQSLARHPRR